VRTVMGTWAVWMKLINESQLEVYRPCCSRKTFCASRITASFAVICDSVSLMDSCSLIVVLMLFQRYPANAMATKSSTIDTILVTFILTGLRVTIIKILAVKSQYEPAAAVLYFPVPVGRSQAFRRVENPEDSMFFGRAYPAQFLERHEPGCRNNLSVGWQFGIGPRSEGSASPFHLKKQFHSVQRCVYVFKHTQMPACFHLQARLLAEFPGDCLRHAEPELDSASRRCPEIAVGEALVVHDQHPVAIPADAAGTDSDPLSVNSVDFRDHRRLPFN